MHLLQVLLPPGCAGCGRFGSLLCRACLRSLEPAGGPPPFLAVDPGLVVGDGLLLAGAAFAHRGAVRRALQRLKYGGAAALARPLAMAAQPAFRGIRDQAGPGAVLVPVPVHAGRRRERGYNQAALLASALAGLSGLRWLDLLVRTRPTVRQHGLDRAARLRNLRAAFSPAPRDPSDRVPETVVLVDDIITTAATLEACAEVLHGLGVARVLGFAIAREV